MKIKTIIGNAVIGIIFAVFAALFMLNVSNMKYYTDSFGDIFLRLILPLMLAGLALFAFKLSKDNRLVIANLFFAFAAAVYAAEWRLTSALENGKASAGGGDKRSKIQVIMDLRESGVDAYPAMRALSLLVDGEGGQAVSDLQSKGQQLLPFGSIGGKTVVSCNESGRWIIYAADRHGFNNPDAAWDGNSLPIGMVGDSFTHGNCVPPEKNMAAFLRKRFGEVVNLGVSGNGPLMQLATLKEYLAPLRPRTVIWFYYEGNDLTENLPYERKSQLLMSYLQDDAFSQGLIGRASEIAGLYENYLGQHLIKAMSRTVNPKIKLMDFLQIYNLRRRLGLDILSLGLFPGATEADYKIFGAALQKASALTQSWGGRFYFVYLPESDRYFGFSRDNPIRLQIHRRVLEIVKRLGIELIDVSETFAAAKDPRRFFYYPGSHYNEQGYEAAASAVALALAAKGPLAK